MARQRGRVLLRRIEDRRRRGICFRKRQAGLVKKAEELAVLCDADVALLVVSPFDGTFHRLAAPTTSYTITWDFRGRFETCDYTIRAKHRKHHQTLSELASNTEKSTQQEPYREKKQGFSSSIAATNRRPSNDDMSIDESSIFQLTIEQLSQIERKVEYALRNTKARKLEAHRIVTVQEKGKRVLEEKDLMKMVSGEEQGRGRHGTGSQQSDGEVDLTLRL